MSEGPLPVDCGRRVEDWVDRADVPKIVCLCGSTKFWREFQKQSLRLTMEGVIVLSIGAASGTDDEHFGNLPREEYDRVKLNLDELHKRKIDLCDEVLVLNVGDYVGESTRSEIIYALDRLKPVVYLEDHTFFDDSRENTDAAQRVTTTEGGES